MVVKDVKTVDHWADQVTQFFSVCCRHGCQTM